jgi:hypothetical protein
VGLELGQCEAKCEVWSSASVKQSVRFGAQPASIQCGVKCEGLVGEREEEEMLLVLQRLNILK